MHRALRRRGRWVVLGGLLAAGAACSRVPAGIPSEPPYITGRITSVSKGGERIGSIRVETQLGDAAGSPKAVARIAQGTEILGPGAKRLDFANLAVGAWVRVWMTGPVAESYPVQGTAATVVVDSARR